LRDTALAALSGGPSGLSRVIATHILTAAAPKKDRTSPQPASPPKVGRGGVDIFVGGGADRLIGRNTLDYQRNYARSSGRQTRYVSHLDTGGLEQAIREGGKSGGPVNVVGHSYGGTAAYNTIKSRPDLRVDNLVTIDPVGRLSRGRSGFTPTQVGNWTNVTAQPGKLNLSDVVALVGGKAPAIPTDYADSNFYVKTNHANFEDMMSAAEIPRLLNGRPSKR